MSFGPPPPPNLSLSIEKKLLVLYLAGILEDEWNEGDRQRALSYARGTTHSEMRSKLPLRLSSLRDTEYKCVFRTTPRQMECLRHILFPYLQVKLPDAVMEGRANGNRSAITVDEKICYGLLVCGGATIGSMIWGNHIVKQTVYNVFDQFIAAILCSRVGEIKFPRTEEEMKQTSDGFLKQKLSLPIYYHCLRPLDGFAIRVWLPGRHSIENQCQFVNRKGFAAMNCQAISDSNIKCIYLNVDNPGGTHDATAWEGSALGQRWKARAENE